MYKSNVYSLQFSFDNMKKFYNKVSQCLSVSLLVPAQQCRTAV